jgi:hypothetical protein
MRYVYFLFLFALLTLWFCAREPAVTTADSPWRNVYNDSVHYVGMATCRSCHQEIHETFVHTGMGRSLGVAHARRSDASFGAHALVYDTLSDLYYFPYLRDSSLFIREFRLDTAGDTIHKRVEQVAYIIGSGHHTNSHLVNFNGYIYQAPITYYTQDASWDLAPGFQDFNERFSRLLTSECITCHNDYPTLAEGSLNRYTSMPEGIACERCHGPGEIHVREKLAGITVDTTTGPDYSIVNPRRLPRDLQMDLCQRCHLQGIALLEPGKTFYDFRPGMPLREIFNVYLPRFTNSHEKFIMASQADRLRLSACYLESEMSCLTCHNPHQSVQELGDTYFNTTCESCHTKSNPSCSTPANELALAGNNCVHCHMPPSGSVDIPHVNITDHYISKTNIRSTTKVEAAEGHFLGLEILTKAQGSHLDLARAYLALYDRYAAETYVLDSAFQRLQKLRDTSALAQQTWIHYWFNQANYPAIIQWAQGRPVDATTDPWTAYRVGQAFAEQAQNRSAVTWLQRAVDLLPQDLDFREKLAVNLAATNQWDQARQLLLTVLADNAKRPLALLNLGYIAARQGQLDRALAYYDQALALDPDYDQALLNKSAIYLLRKESEKARELLRRVLEITPEHPTARRLWAELG